MDHVITHRIVRVRCCVFVLLCIGLLSAIAGCTQAERSLYGGYGHPHSIELYSGGILIGEWQTEGKVLSEDNSDGYYFTDSATGKLVRVTGDVIIRIIE